MPTYRYASPWDFKEHQRAYRAVSRVTLRRKPWRRAFRWSFPGLLLGILFGTAWLRGGLRWDLTLLVSALAWLIFCVFWVVLLHWGEPYLAARKTRRLDPSARGVVTRTVDDDGFRVDGTGQSVILQWQGIHSIVESPEFLLVFPNENGGYYLAKRLVPSPDELDSLRQFMRARLGEKAHLGGVALGSAA